MIYSKDFQIYKTFFFIDGAPNSDTLLDKILPTLISVIVIIILFLIGRFIDKRIRNKTIQNQWYLDVIIKPNAYKIESFIKEVTISLGTTHKIISCAVFTQKNNDSIISLTAVEIGRFQEIKRKFEFDFIALINSNNSYVAKYISKLTRELEDDLTKHIDELKASVCYKNHLIKIDKTLYNYKNNLFKILYSPLKI